jgi:hypothetical protein
VKLVTDETLRSIDWYKLDKVIADELNVSVVTVWRWRKLAGQRSDARKGPVPKDRSGWDWSMNNTELSKLHGVTRQRVHQIRKYLFRARNGLPKTDDKVSVC